MSAPVDLDEVEHAAAAMTTGKWFIENNQRFDGATGVMVIVNRGSSTSSRRAAVVYRKEDAAGVVALRDAAPKMIAELRDLRAGLAEAKRLGLKACEVASAIAGNRLTCDANGISAIAAALEKL